MSIERLKKLVELANHNPNEHEANSAARAACKLLETLKYNLTAKATVTSPSNPTGHKYSTYDDVFDMASHYAKAQQNYDRERRTREAERVEKIRAQHAKEEAERKAREWEAKSKNEKKEDIYSRNWSPGNYKVDSSFLNNIPCPKCGTTYSFFGPGCPKCMLEDVINASKGL